jgi:hypothetical protein
MHLRALTRIAVHRRHVSLRGSLSVNPVVPERARRYSGTPFRKVVGTSLMKRALTTADFAGSLEVVPTVEDTDRDQATVRDGESFEVA